MIPPPQTPARPAATFLWSLETVGDRFRIRTFRKTPSSGVIFDFCTGNALPAVSMFFPLRYQALVWTQKNLDVIGSIQPTRESKCATWTRVCRTRSSMIDSEGVIYSPAAILVVWRTGSSQSHCPAEPYWWTGTGRGTRTVSVNGCSWSGGPGRFICCSALQLLFVVFF